MIDPEKLRKAILILATFHTQVLEEIRELLDA